jgi:hypothetical protein
MLPVYYREKKRFLSSMNRLTNSKYCCESRKIISFSSFLLCHCSVFLLCLWAIFANVHSSLHTGKNRKDVQLYSYCTLHRRLSKKIQDQRRISQRFLDSLTAVDRRKLPEKGFQEFFSQLKTKVPDTECTGFIF